MTSARRPELKGEGYAVVARHLADGSYVDDGPCGATQRLRFTKFKNLLRFAHAHR